MKITRYILLISVAVAGLTSCNGWLDVSPKTQVKSDDMFRTEEGFRDAIYGIYTIMARSAAYGGEFAMASLDVIPQTYSIVSDEFTNIEAFAYLEDNARTKIDGMWSTCYFAIANCNNLLANIDSRKSIFSEGTYEITKAEAMAARAFLHFDLLRAFGPVPTPENLAKPSLPIMLGLTAVPSEFSTGDKVIEFVLSEAEEARKLIAPVDPLGPEAGYYEEEEYGDNSTPGTDAYTDGGFKLYRRSRLNYYGITALMARAAMWAGRTEDALKYAREVIDSGQFRMMTEDEYNNQAFLMGWISSNEYISSLYKSKISTELEERYFLRAEGSNASWNEAALYFTEEGLTDLFGTDRDFDWRFKKFITQNAHGDFVPVKYQYGNRIPLVKIAEMYLIVAEVNRSVETLNELRDHRGYENNRLDPVLTDFDEALTNEYRREFFAEGQLFYYYKRLNMPAFPNGKQAGEKVYVLPLPDDETEFGNVGTGNDNQ